MKKISIILLILILGFQMSFAQDKTITGVVTTSEDGSPLMGVTVAVPGTTRGTTTDLDGKYTLKVPTATSTIVFSYVGHSSHDITIGNRTVINVILELSFADLDEIIVIGYGATSKESLTGAVEVVKSEQFEMTQLATIETALQGSVTGLQMTAMDGQPGANTQIRIRGIGSINASSEPLYVVDGIPVQTGSLSVTDNGNGGRSTNVLSTLNPNDIESVSVLKDASATAIYGSRGANGVIIITTKSGRKGESRINFSSSVGFSSAAYNGLHKSLNGEQYTTLFLEGYMNKGETEEEAQARFDKYYPNPANTNWLDEITQNGMVQQYNLNASGGSDNLTYFASLSYFDKEGYLIGTGFDRLSSRLNLTANLTDKLTVTNNISIGRTNTVGTSDGTAWDSPIYGAYLVAPVIPVYDEQGLFYADHKGFFMGGANPVGRLLEDERWLKQNRIIDNLIVSYDIMKNITLRSAWSFDVINISEFEFENARFGDGRRVGGRSNEGSIENVNWIGTQTLNYNKNFGGGHSFDALFGYEAQHSERRSLEARAEGFPNPTLRTLTNAANPTLATSSATQYSFVSMFSRFSYNYGGKYFATASYRRDGSSRFGIDKRWGNFWSAGLAWKVTGEDFLSDTDWLDNLKVRVSYGVTGNASIGNFDALSLYGFGYDYSGIPGSAPTNIGNPSLTWESQNTLDIGFDISVFNRLNATVTYFNRANTNLLLDRPLSMTTGFESNTQNVGDMLNTGIEIDANANIANNINGFNWDLGFNFTAMKNEITKLDEPILSNPFRREEGRDFYEYFMWRWAGVDPATGHGLWFTDSTETETTDNIKDAERSYIGKSSTPSFFGGLNTSLSYKGFTLSAQVVLVWNKYFYDVNGFVIAGDGRYTPRSTSLYAYENRWTEEGQDSEFPKHFWGNTTKSNQKYQTRYLYDATYARLRDLTFSYDLPRSATSRMGITSFRIFAKGANLLTWVRNKDLHLDPEAEVDGTVSGLQPQLKTISFGISLTL